MADTAFDAFTPVTSLLATDKFLAQRSAGGINFTAATLAAFVGANAGDGTVSLPGMAFASDTDTGIFRPGSNILGIVTGGTERARFSGNAFGIKTTSPLGILDLGPADAGDNGAELRLRGSGNAARDWILANYQGVLRFITTTKGDYGSFAPQFACDSSQFYPGSDNALNLGYTTNRWKQLYAVTNVISTSDEREKLWLVISEDRRAKDRRIARKILDELGWYQRLDAVEAKGKDGARWHFGPRAQRVWSIVAAEGLCAPLVGAGPDQRPDPSWIGPPPPAWLCFDVWPEEWRTDPIYSQTLIGPDEKPLMVGTKDVLVRSAGNRFGLRVDQMGLLLDRELHERLNVLEAAA